VYISSFAPVQDISFGSTAVGGSFSLTATAPGTGTLVLGSGGARLRRPPVSAAQQSCKGNGCAWQQRTGDSGMECFPVQAYQPGAQHRCYATGRGNRHAGSVYLWNR
jgi:hypothetical protein